MDKLELLLQLLNKSVKDLDEYDNTDDYILGIRTGYLLCIGSILDIKKLD